MNKAEKILLEKIYSGFKALSCTIDKKTNEITIELESKDKPKCVHCNSEDVEIKGTESKFYRDRIDVFGRQKIKLNCKKIYCNKCGKESVEELTIKNHNLVKE